MLQRSRADINVESYKHLHDECICMALKISAFSLSKAIALAPCHKTPFFTNAEI